MFQWVIQQYKKVIIFSVIAVLFGLYSMQFLSFNHDFEQYFPQESLAYEQYQQHLQRFEVEDNWFFISPETSPDGIFETSYQSSVDRYIEQLRALPGIEKVENPLQVRLPVYTFLGWQTLSVFPEQFNKDTLKNFLLNSPELYGSLVARDFSSVLIKVHLKKDFPADSNGYLYEQLLQLGKSYSFHQIHMGGRFPSEQVYIEYLQTETILFTSLSAGFIVLVLYFMYGSVSSILVPFVAVLLSVLWTLTCMTWFGKSLDILTIMLPPILFVITISDLTHLYSRYLEEKANTYLSNREAMLIAISEVGPATFITAFTTAAGFISFLSSPIIPIKQFGIYACVGVFISYFIAYFIFPSLLLTQRSRPLKKSRSIVQSTIWEKQMLPSLLKFSIRNYKAVFVVTLLLIVLGVWGTTRLKVNSFLLDDVPKNSSVKEDMLFLETNFHGVRPLELSLTFQEGTVWEESNWRKAIRVQETIEKNYSFAPLTSIVSLLKTMNKGLHGNETAYYQLPTDADTLEWCMKEIKKLRKRKELKQLVSPDGKSIRFMTTLPDKGSDYYTQLNSRLIDDIQTVISEKEVFFITGSSHLLDENANSLTNDLTLDLLIGIVVISLLMSILFKGVKMVLIALLPNILPLILTAGFMGWVGIDLKPSNALIFSIAFGIAVDDSIHFLARYRHESRVHSNLKAIFITYLSTGKAMIFTALVVISGFVCLLFSSFQSIFYMGLLVSCTLFFAIFCDMLVLPGLLYIAKRKFR